MGALDVVPPEVEPNATVAVAAMFRVNPPVPVQVKRLAVAIDNTVVPATVLVSAMLPAPNEIARVELPDELKIPVLKVNPASARVPAVKVVVTVLARVHASPSVTVPAVFMVMPKFKVTPFVVMVDVPAAVITAAPLVEVTVVAPMVKLP